MQVRSPVVVGSLIAVGGKLWSSIIYYGRVRMVNLFPDFHDIIGVEAHLLFTADDKRAASFTP